MKDQKKNFMIMVWEKIKKPFIVALVIVAVLGFVVNIYFAYIKPNGTPNLFTAISGWVSGFATAIIGIFALSQGKEYKEEGDKHIILNNLRNARQEMENYMENYLQTALSVKVSFDCICKELQSATLSDISKTMFNNSMYNYCNKISFFIRKLILDRYFFVSKVKLIESLKKMYEHINITTLGVNTIKENPNKSLMDVLMFESYRIGNEIIDNFCSFSNNAENHIRELQNMSSYAEIKDRTNAIFEENESYFKQNENKIKEDTNILKFK